MSRKLRETSRFLKDVEQMFRRTQFSYDGQKLSTEDNQKIASLYTCWIAILYEDSTLRCLPQTLQCRRIMRTLAEKDVRAILASCKEAYTLVVQNKEVGYPCCYEDFKHLLRQKCTDVSLIGDFKGLIVQVLASEPSTTNGSREEDLFRTLCTWLLFPTKVNLRLEVLEREAYEAYLKSEEDLADDIEMTTEEAGVLQRWFPREASRYLYHVLAGHHGSGSVAEGYGSISEKYRKWTKSDQLLDYVTKKVGHVPPEEISTAEGIERKARVTFVPKSFSSYRTISAEPASLMYWQEGLFEAITKDYKLADWVYPFSEFQRIYNPMTQEPNRRAALAGSRDGSIVTIDLHAASDSVRLEHVKRWFRKTCLYEWLVATRSRRSIMPDGREILLRKYAPMGNATTFLVETACFAAITECAIVEQGGNPARVRWGVYGDDIYVDQRYALAVIQRLELNGFTVNQEKTLIWGATGFFRESCGVFALNGVDVTPLVCSRKFEDVAKCLRVNKNSVPTEPSVIAEVCDLANRAYEHGYQLLRAYLIGHLLRLPQKFRPAFGDAFTDGVLWSNQPENHHLNWRWNAALQLWEVQHGVGKMKRTGRHDDLIDLYEALRSTRFRQTPDAEPVVTDTTARRGCTYWAPKWTPVSHLVSGCQSWENPPLASAVMPRGKMN